MDSFLDPPEEEQGLMRLMQTSLGPYDLQTELGFFWKRLAFKNKVWKTISSPTYHVRQLEPLFGELRLLQASHMRTYVQSGSIPSTVLEDYNWFEFMGQIKLAGTIKKAAVVTIASLAAVGFTGLAAYTLMPPLNENSSKAYSAPSAYSTTHQQSQGK